MDHIRNRQDVVKGLTSPEIRTDDTIPFVDEPVDTPVRNELLNPQHDKPFDPKEIEIRTEIPYVGDTVEIVTEKVPVKPQRFKLNDTENETPEVAKAPRVIHATDLGDVHKSPDKDTIVVNTPEGTLYITLEPDRFKSNPTCPSLESTEISTPCTSKAYGAKESRALIDNEIDVESRRVELRRNSISMPTLQNLELEVLKQYWNNNAQEEVSYAFFYL